MSVMSNKVKKKAKLLVSEGVVHIYATFNNTLITITDRQGNTIASASPGGNGFKNSRKSTPYAAQIAAEKAGSTAKDRHALSSVVVVVKGAGPGRDPALRAILGLGFSITDIIDKTPIPHNGCRPEKRRRV